MICELQYEIPVKLWAVPAEIESSAFDQIKNMANHPRAFHHVAIMPDVHTGYGMPIGGVLATTDGIIPEAVGVDIGCGMHAVRTSLTVDMIGDNDKVILKRWIESTIPLGKNHRQSPTEWDGFANAPDIPIVQQELESAQYQLGTLGGGNHFIEMQADEENRIWIMLHSGSRNFGYKIANEYIRIAKETCQDTCMTGGLFYFSGSDVRYYEYFNAMKYACDFAKKNREVMMADILSGLKILFDIEPQSWEQYDVIHNYAAVEEHFDTLVLIHRKGATSAKANEIGIIPGSQGSSSYIVRGRGNPASFMSCSHGSGRIMSRSKAKEQLDLATEIKRLDDMGVVHSITTIKDLDEAAGAYKDINQVMKNQEDLVEILHMMRPLMVVKG